MRGEPGERPLPAPIPGRRTVIRAARLPAAGRLGRGRLGLADRLVRLEQRLAVRQDVAHGRFDPGGERARPDLGGQQAQVSFQVEPVEPGQRLVDPADPQIGPEEGKADGSLTQQGGEQGRVRDVQPGHPGLRYGGISAHRRTPVPLLEPCNGSFPLTADTIRPRQPAAGERTSTMPRQMGTAPFRSGHPQWPRRRASHILGDIAPRRGHHADLVLPGRRDSVPAAPAGYPVTWLRRPGIALIERYLMPRMSGAGSPGCP